MTRAVNLLVALLKPRTEILLSPLSPQACAERLTAGIDGYLAILGLKPFIGSANADAARLRKRVTFGNQFQTIMLARFQSADGGTTITCRSGMSIFAYTFLIFWFGMTALQLTIGLTQEREANDVFFIVVPLLLALWGTGFTLFYRWRARDEHDQIIRFIKGRTEAVDAPFMPRQNRPIVA